MSCVSQSKLLAEFEKTVWTYYRKHGRDLPWRRTRDPYKILVSEIMLHQTQVSRVVLKYKEFLKRFPTIRSLARAPVSDVLSVWRGLGYNRRALSLRRAAEIIITRYRGTLPQTVLELDALPGVGPATAASICAFAFNRPHPFIETNIRRVYIHHFFQRQRTVSDAQIMELVAKTLDREKPREWYWALMDYGADLSRRVENPNRRSAAYAHQSRFEGSNRELRSKVLSYVLDNGPSTERLIRVKLNMNARSVKRNLASMVREGFFSVSDGRYEIARSSAPVS